MSTRFADNSYEGTFGDEGWGAGASAILLQTRGKDFRHEKTKKKRGTYRGGKIDSMSTRSIKYDSSSDEEISGASSNRRRSSSHDR